MKKSLLALSIFTAFSGIAHGKILPGEQINKVVVRHDKQIDANSADIKKLQDNTNVNNSIINDMKDNLDGFKDTIKNNADNIANVSTDLGKVNDKVNGINNSIGQNNIAIADHTSRIVKLEKGVEHLNDITTVQSTQALALKKQGSLVQGLEEEFASIGQVVDKHTEVIKKQGDKMEVLVTDVTENTRLSKANAEKVTENSEAIETNKADIAQNKTDIKATNDRVTQVEVDYKAADEVVLKTANDYTDVRVKEVSGFNARNIHSITYEAAQTHANEVGRLVLEQSKEYTNSRVNQVQAELRREIKEVSKEARQAGAVGLAASALPFDTTPGKFSMAASGASWEGETAYSVGFGYTERNGKMRAQLAASGVGRKVGASVGVGYTF